MLEHDLSVELVNLLFRLPAALRMPICCFAQMTKAVEEAIRDCDMNLNPLVEGQGQVNVPIPKPTKESREAVVKVASKATEKVHEVCWVGG